MSRLVNGSDMLDMVRDMCGGETESVLTRERILIYINQSYYEVAAATRSDLLGGTTTVTTSSGTAEYTLSSDDVLKINDFVDETNNILLEEISETQYHEYTQGNPQTGTPVYWFISGADTSGKWKVTFWPTPAGTYTIVGHILSKPISINADNADVPSVLITHELYDDSIIYRAAARGWAMLGDTKKAREYRNLARDNDSVAGKVARNTSEVRQTMVSPIGKALRSVR